MALHATFFVNLRTEDEAYDQTTGSLSRALWCRWQQKGSSLSPLRLLSLVLTADQTTVTGPPPAPKLLSLVLMAAVLPAQCSGHKTTAVKVQGLQGVARLC